MQSVSDMAISKCLHVPVNACAHVCVCVTQSFCSSSYLSRSDRLGSCFTLDFFFILSRASFADPANSMPPTVTVLRVAGDGALPVALAGMSTRRGAATGFVDDVTADTFS